MVVSNVLTTGAFAVARRNEKGHFDGGAERRALAERANDSERHTHAPRAAVLALQRCQDGSMNASRRHVGGDCGGGGGEANA